MGYFVFLGLILMGLGLGFSTYLNTRAFQELNDEQRKAFVDVYRQNHLTSVLMPVLLFLMFAGIMHFKLLPTIANWLLFALCYTLFFAYITNKMRHKLEAAYFSQNFIKQYLFARGLNFLGTVAFLATVLISIIYI